MPRKPRKDTSDALFAALEKSGTWRQLAADLGYTGGWFATLNTVALRKDNACSIQTEREIRGRLGLPPLLSPRRKRIDITGLPAEGQEQIKSLVEYWRKHER